MNTTTLTRRGVLAGTASACLAGAAPAMSAPAGHPDAELLELGQQRRRLIENMQANRGISDEESNRIADEWLALDERIMALNPTTPAGLSVQLDVVWWDSGMEHDHEPHRSTVWFRSIMSAAESMGKKKS